MLLHGETTINCDWTFECSTEKQNTIYFRRKDIAFGIHICYDMQRSTILISLKVFILLI
ncbi:hypothetical protein JHK87_046852 [Glycine soja]|nr:hypothetical protein JHK87_046852 [Glycine soja]